jgi:DNA-binding FadR family transcriptional regulator
MTAIGPSTAKEATRIIGREVLRPRQQVEDTLRQAIVTGEVRNGERLPSEAELARQFRVSRPTVREALRALESNGLIRKVSGAGGGSFVRSVDYHSLGEMLQESVHNLLKLGSLTFDEVAVVRQHLEVPSAALAALNRTDEEVAELRAIVDQQRRRSVTDPDVPQLDALFHTSIARMSRNRILSSFVYALHRESEPVHYLELSPEVGRETVVQHQKIVKAIAEKDPTAAELAIAEHLTYLREHITAAADVAEKNLLLAAYAKT